jgi:L-iditol 2-dehydrogenase
MRIMGFHRDGGFAEYVSAPAASLIELPSGLAFEDAVFAEPLSCCLNALELARVSSGERVGVWGAGTAGTLLARAGRALGAEVTAIEPDPARRRRAGALARPPAGQVFDVVIPAVGDVGAYREALASLGPRGRLVAFSGLAADASAGLVDTNQLHYLEQTCVGAYGCSYRHGVAAIKQIADGGVGVRDLVTHRLLLGEVAEALELVRRRAGMKILIYPTAQKRERHGSERS